MPLSDKISLVYIKPNIKMFCYSYQLTFKSPASALVAVAKATEMLHLQTTGIYGVSNYSSWCLNTFLTSILVWEVLTPILDLLGKLKGNGFLWNNRSKWNILAKGSIRCGYITFFQVNLHYLFFFFFPELQLCWANLRGETENFLLFCLWWWPLSLNESYQDTFIEFVHILHMYCIMMLKLCDSRPSLSNGNKMWVIFIF